MRIRRLSNSSPQTPYIPLWDFSFGYAAVPLRTDKLALTCLENEKYIKKLPQGYSDGYTGLGKKSTTARFSQYNVLEWDTVETNLLKKYVKMYVKEYNMALGNETPEYLWSRCWVNILRWRQKINVHWHDISSRCYLSAHFTVQSDNTSTCYMNPFDLVQDPDVIEEENSVGQLTIFPSYIPHYTTRHYSFKPRITIAMDIATDLREGNWVLL